MNRDKLVNMLGDHRIPGVFCSSDGAGEVNAAVFGSVRLLDNRTVAMALGDNRTLKNLHKNPKATYILFTQGQTLLTWKGARLYLEVERFENSGPLFEEIVAQAESSAGKSVAQILKTAIVFTIVDVRPLIDSAQ